MNLYKNIIRPLMFLLKPETAHRLTMKLLSLFLFLPGVKKLLKSYFQTENKTRTFIISGLTFKNRVGIAAGFDKNALYMKELYHLGFGFLEIGTITPLPQTGNPKPRLFRLPSDQALINRMGFNNDGADIISKRIHKFSVDFPELRKNIILGANISKNKSTLNDRAHLDCETCMNKLNNFVDYFTINVSSPNTPGLRDLMEKDILEKLIFHVSNCNKKFNKPKPLFLKIAPDIENAQLIEIIQLISNSTFKGIICANTTISRENLRTNKKRIEFFGNGGLSGSPLNIRSTELISFIRKNSPSDLVIIGSGGIQSSIDANEKFKSGADLVQLYTGFIYKGPWLVKDILIL